MTGTPLEPVRAEMLRQARAEAEAVVARAESYAAEQAARAQAEAEAILDEARARGEAEAGQALRARTAQARRQARTIELQARRDIHESWREAVADGVRGLRQSAEYPEILERLTDRARGLLGADAEVVADPSGGLRAASRGRRADLTLDAIAIRAAENAEGEAGDLWTP